MGPVSAKSYPGQQAVNVNVRPAPRAKQEIDYGRRGKGYVYGALWETRGDCWTQCYQRRTKEHFIDFLFGKVGIKRCAAERQKRGERLAEFLGFLMGFGNVFA